MKALGRYVYFRAAYLVLVVLQACGLGGVRLTAALCALVALELGLRFLRLQARHQLRSGEAADLRAAVSAGLRGMTDEMAVLRERMTALENRVPRR